MAKGSLILSLQQRIAWAVPRGFTLSAGIEYQELHGQDTNPGIINDDSVYTGVEFVTKIPSKYPINEKYLLLLKLSNGLWLIPDESKYKFNQSSVKLDFVVDGGVLNTFFV